MDSNLMSGFPEAWEAYRIRVKGALLEKRSQGPLTAAAARLAVRTEEAIWEDPYSPCGSWLAGIAERDANAGRRVLDAVRSFSPIEPPSPPEHSGLVEAGAAALALGTAGGAGVRALGAAIPAAVGTGLVVAAVTGIVTNQALRARKSNETRSPIDDYLEQLDLVRQEIEGILDEEEEVA